MNKTILLSFFIAFSFIAFSQNMDFSHLTIHEGLSSNIVYSIAQDSNKLFWFGTRVGVDRYDGHSFKNYKLENTKNGTYITSIVKSVVIDKNNKIWAGTSSGLFFYNPQKDKFEIFNRAGFQNKELTIHFLSCHDDDLWIGGQGFLYKYNQKTDKLDSLSAETKSFLSLYTLDKKTFVVGTSNGIFKLNTSNLHKLRNDIEQIK